MKHFKRLSLFLAGAVVFTSMNFGMSQAATTQEGNNEMTVIIELNEPSILEKAVERGVTYSDLSTNDIAMQSQKIVYDQEMTLMAIKKDGIDIQKEREFTTVLNAFSATIKEGDFEKLSSNPRVKSIRLAETFHLPKPNMISSIDDVGAPASWALGYKGEGQIIAVIDSGMDILHPDFKVTQEDKIAISKTGLAQTLAMKALHAETLQTGGLSADLAFKNAKVPFAYDYADKDTNVKGLDDHGQHVSGIAAANGFVKGVAPEAQLLAMKVFSDVDDTTTEDILLQAIEDAVLLKADVINMSLGAPAGFTNPQDPLQKAIKVAHDAGTVVVVSAGNDGRYGRSAGFNNISFDTALSNNTDIGMIGSIACANESLSVANFIPTYLYTDYYIKDSNGELYLYTLLNGSPLYILGENKPFEYLEVGDGSVEAMALLNLKGKVALVENSELSLSEIAYNTHQKGAVALITSSYKFSDDDFSKVIIPILRVEGYVISNLKNEASKVLTSSSSLKSVYNPENGSLEISSSWGATPSLDFKPEIAAPGTNIFSTLNDGIYGQKTGTSMAAPSVAGAGALMTEKFKKTPELSMLPLKERSLMIKNLLMSTAKPLSLGSKWYFSPRQQGAGAMDIESALKTGAYVYHVSPNSSEKTSKVTLKEIQNKKAVFDVTLDNFSGEEQSFILLGSAQTDNLINNNHLGTVYENEYINRFPMYLKDASLSVALNQYTTYGKTSLGSQTKPVFVEEAFDGHQFDILKTEITTTSSSAIRVKVPANEKASLQFTLDLSKVNLQSTSYGVLDYFAEGFIRFVAEESTYNPDLGIPYMGYQGNWDKQPVFSRLYHEVENGVVGLLGYVDEEYNTSFIGGYLKDDYEWKFSERWTAFSPNGDNYLDQVGPILTFERNTKILDVLIRDGKGNDLGYLTKGYYKDLKKPTTYDYVPRFIEAAPNNYFSKLIWDGTLNGKPLPDGQYQYVLQTKIDYPTAVVKDKPIKVFIDRTKPVIKKASLKTETLGKQTIALDISENHFVKEILFKDEFGNGVKLKSGKTLERIFYEDLPSIDFSQITNKTVYVSARDFAGNISEPVKVLPLEVKEEKKEEKKEETSSGGGMGGFGGAGASTPTEKAPSFKLVNPRYIRAALEKGIARVDVSSAAILEAARYAPDAVVEVPEEYVKGPVEVNLSTDVFEVLARLNKKLTIKVKDAHLTLRGEFSPFKGVPQFIVKMKAVTPDYKALKGYEPLNMAYDFEISNGKENIKDFNVQPEVSFTLPKEVKTTDALKIGVQNEDLSWTLLESTFDEEKNVITAKAPHFSVYGLFKTAQTKTFDDIKGHWAQKTIEEMAALQITNGVTDRLFAPNKNVTRAEFIAWILRALGEKAEGTKLPEDVSKNAWYAPTLAKALEIGLIEEGAFRPTDDITREEMAKFITIGHSKRHKITPTFDEAEVVFKDVKKDSDASKYIYYLARHKIVSGYQDTTFKPENKAIRAEAMTMIKNMISK